MATFSSVAVICEVDMMEYYKLAVVFESQDELRRPLMKSSRWQYIVVVHVFPSASQTSHPCSAVDAAGSGI